MATDAAKTEPPPAAAATTALQAASPSDEPPGLMAAKTEGTQPSQQVKPSAPYIIDSTLLGPDSKVEKNSDGKIYVTTAGNTEEISEMLYQTLLHQNMKRVASSSIPTGLASHMEEDDSEPIEWGDMDPAFARLLQSTPALLSAFKTLRSPKKMAKLDIATVSFQPSTNVALPEPSPAVTLPDSVTLDNIKDTIRSYHDTTVQPSLDLLNKHIRHALQEASYSDLYNNAHEDLQIWWDRLVKPLEPDDDPLFELPKWTDQINYKAPNKTYFMMQTPFFTQLGNSISSCNIQSCSHFLSLMEEALTPVAQNVVDEYSLPSPSSVANLDLTIKDLTTLVWLPWDHMVRTSYSLALEHYQIPLVWDIPSIDSLLNKFLPGMEQPFLQQFVDNLVEIVHKHPVTIDIFGGLPPFTNAPLKKLASAGSYFFDQVYAQLASLLQVQTTTKQNLVAPNDAFTEIYDLFMYSISPDSPLYQHSDQYRNRHWNNKGNSLEALSLILAEYGYHSLVWIMAWICIQLSYKDKSYSFVNPYVTC